MPHWPRSAARPGSVKRPADLDGSRRPGAAGRRVDDTVHAARVDRSLRGHRRADQHLGAPLPAPRDLCRPRPGRPRGPRRTAGPAHLRRARRRRAPQRLRAPGAVLRGRPRVRVRRGPAAADRLHPGPPARLRRATTSTCWRRWTACPSWCARAWCWRRPSTPSSRRTAASMASSLRCAAPTARAASSGSGPGPGAPGGLPPESRHQRRDVIAHHRVDAGVEHPGHVRGFVDGPGRDPQARPRAPSPRRRGSRSRTSGSSTRPRARAGAPAVARRSRPR